MATNMESVMIHLEVEDTVFSLDSKLELRLLSDELLLSDACRLSKWLLGCWGNTIELRSSPEIRSNFLSIVMSASR